MAGFSLIALVVLSLFTSHGESQFFPFSNLLQHAKHLSTEAALPVQEVKIQTNDRPSRQAAEAEPLIVHVTPRPRYSPQSFLQEPAVDPNSRSVPSMLPDKIPKRQPPKSLTLVESVPALTVVIPADSFTPGNKGGLPDYLVPPKHPSIYNTADMKQHKKPTKHPLKSYGESTLRYQPNPTVEAKETLQHVKDKDYYNKKNSKRKLLPPKSYKSLRPSETKVESKVAYPPNKINSESGFSSPNSLKEFGTAERVEFQMHGQAGPDSYKFGYDTGEGKNRQFRYEEKDHAGNVKGQYGYYDKEGKLKIYNYQADSNGFRSQPL